MLGLRKGFVRLLPHNEAWHQLFEEERARLLGVIGENVTAIEHIGSTSVCGISAKPILDIAIAINDKSSGEKCAAPLEEIGYEYRGENGIEGRFYFVKGEPRTHHLHLLLSDSVELRNHLFFRDYLLQNPAVAEEYDKLKNEMAKKFPENRNAYLEGKADFVEKILKRSVKKKLIKR